jgi:TRAP-type uncharacterized transport system substrate-binding protein
MKSKENAAVRKTFYGRIAAPLVEIFGLSWGLAFTTVLFVAVVLATTVYWSIHTSPPRTFIISSGPPGSIFETYALRYSNFLYTNVNIRLKVLPSQGSLENLDRLNDPSFKVDVGFVQGGNTNGAKSGKLVSLGSVYNMPLLVFYRATNAIDLLSNFRGKKLAIGPQGSGTRSLALTLLELSGISTNGATQLLDWDPDTATQSLLTNQIDAVFMTGDSAPPALMRKLLHAPEIRLMDFAQAGAYARRVSFLNEMDVPRGGFDLTNDIPDHDIRLIGPTVELIARATLHPALSDQLSDAARDVHKTAGIFRRQGQFPSLEEHDFKISEEAQRYHTRGKTFLYQWFPFWLAAILNLVVVAVFPVLLVLIPGLKIIPALFKWRTKLVFYRWYRALLNLEKELKGHVPPDKLKEALVEVDEIDRAVSKMKVPASFANDYYSLRSNVDFVREQLSAAAK